MPTHLRRVNEPGHVHFWTISCYHRLAFFHHDEMKDIAVCALDEMRKRFHICLIGYVIMPDHVHILVFRHAPGNDEGADISLLLQSFKQRAGFHGKEWMRDCWRRHGRLWSDALTEWATSSAREKSIWNTRGHDFNITERDKLIEKLDYCHKNPLTRGLVERPEDWKWSSYRALKLDDPMPIAVDWDGSWPIIW